MNPLSHFPMDQIQAMQAPMQTPQGLTPQFGPALPDQPQQMSLSARPMRRADKLRLKVDAAGAKQDVTTSMSYIQNQIALSQAREQAINEEIQRIQGTLMGGQIPQMQQPQFSQNQLYATGINYLLGGNIGQTATYFNQDNQKHAEQDYQRRLAQYQQERDMLDMQLKQKYGVSQDERNYQQQLGGLGIQDQFNRDRLSQQARIDQEHQDRQNRAEWERILANADTEQEALYAMQKLGIDPNSMDGKGFLAGAKRKSDEFNQRMAFNQQKEQGVQGRFDARLGFDKTKFATEQKAKEEQFNKLFEQRDRNMAQRLAMFRQSLEQRNQLAQGIQNRFGDKQAMDLLKMTAQFGKADIQKLQQKAKFLQQKFKEAAAQMDWGKAFEYADGLGTVNSALDEAMLGSQDGQIDMNKISIPSLTGPIGGGQPKKQPQQKKVQPKVDTTVDGVRFRLIPR